MGSSTAKRTATGNPPASQRVSRLADLARSRSQGPSAGAERRSDQGLLRDVQLDALDERLKPDLELGLGVVLAQRRPQSLDGGEVLEIELSVAFGDARVALVESEIDGGGPSTLHDRLQQQVPQEETAEGTVDVNSAILGEPYRMNVLRKSSTRLRLRSGGRSHGAAGWRVATRGKA